MGKTSFKRIFLVIYIIMTLLAPSICTDIVYAVDENVQEEEQEDLVEENTITSEVNDETSSDVEEQNATEDAVENTNTIPEKSEEELNVQDETIAEDTTATVSETPQVMAINQEVAPIQEMAVATSTVIGVDPGANKLQEAILNAQPGSTIKLKQGTYTGSNIVINKDITIIGAGRDGVNNTRIDPAIIIQGQNSEKLNVVLENFATNNQPPQDGFVYFDIKSPVNLTINNAMVFHILRDWSKVDTIKSTAVNLEANSNGSTVNINNSYISTTYESIVIDKASNNIINLNKSQIDGRMAFKLESGNGNAINITDSTVNGRSIYSSEDEAISIIAQSNLNIDIKDSKITGVDAKGNGVTHLFSFDGTKASNNVRISITGTSTIDDKFGATGSSIFNFGASNTPNNSNSIYVENGVQISPNIVSKKYATNTAYATVGIFDENRNLTIKAYDKNQKIEELKTLKETIAGCTWEKKIDELTEPFELDDVVEENMDLYAIMPVKVDVHINEHTYSFPEGKAIKDMYEQYPDLQNDINELKGRNGFKRFVDQDGTEINEETAILKETTIIPKYNVKVKIVTDTSSDEYPLEQGKLLADLGSSILDKYEKLTDKRFVNYVEVGKEENVLTDSSTIDKDIEIKPEYEVDVQIKDKTYTLKEGKTLNDLDNDKKEEIQKNVNVDNKIFTQHFQDNASGDVDYNTSINKHTTLTPKYNVEVIVEKFGGDTKRYEIPENTSLRTNLQAEEITGLDEFVKVDTKTFEKYVNDNGETVNYDTPITENTHFLAVYRAEITVTIKGNTGDKSYTVETGENLNSLGDSVVTEIKGLVEKPNKTLSHFVDSENNEVDFTTSIQKTTTLTPKYKITVTVKPKYDPEQTFEMPEGSALSAINGDLEQFENKTNKEFKKYTNATGDTDIAKDNTYNENVVIVPHYDIKIKIEPKFDDSKEITVVEGSTIEGIASQLVDFETNVTDKIFVKYIDSEEQEIARSKVLTENTTIIPEYNIKITVQKIDASTKEYVIAEGTVLSRLPVEEMNELKTFVAVPNKEFAEKFTDTDKNEVDMYTILYKNTILTPKYNVKVQVEEVDGTVVEFTVEEGKTLKDLSQEEIERLQAIKDNHEEGKRFAKFINSETGEEVGENTPITQGLVIKPIYEEIPVTEEITPSNEITNPKTFDNILNFVALGLIGLACIIISIIAYRRKNK